MTLMGRKVDTTINLQNLISVLAISGGLTVWGIALSINVANNTRDIAHHGERMAKFDQYVASAHEIEKRQEIVLGQHSVMLAQIYREVK